MFLINPVEMKNILPFFIMLFSFISNSRSCENIKKKKTGGKEKFFFLP